uniref:Uncharacterized protein n=1 Tax=Octopus bimaculoides TaxID=37653 RepID=A0A0L8I4P8_OCTBM
MADFILFADVAINYSTKCITEHFRNVYSSSKYTILHQTTTLYNVYKDQFPLLLNIISEHFSQLSRTFPDDFLLNKKEAGRFLKQLDIVENHLLVMSSISTRLLQGNHEKARRVMLIVLYTNLVWCKFLKNFFSRHKILVKLYMSMVSNANLGHRIRKIFESTKRNRHLTL